MKRKPNRKPNRKRYLLCVSQGLLMPLLPHSWPPVLLIHGRDRLEALNTYAWLGTNTRP